MAITDNVKYTNLSASAQIKDKPGAIYGFIVNSHTGGSIKLWDSATASGTVIMNTFTFPTGSSIFNFTEGVSFNTALYATIGGTADVTILWK